MGWFAVAPALKKLPRKPRSATALRRFAPPGLRSARLPREFFKCLRSANQPKTPQTAASHKRSRSKTRRILSSHVICMIRGRFAGSGRFFLPWLRRVFFSALLLGGVLLCAAGSLCREDQNKKLYQVPLILVRKSLFFFEQIRIFGILGFHTNFGPATRFGLPANCPAT